MADGEVARSIELTSNTPLTMEHVRRLHAGLDPNTFGHPVCPECGKDAFVIRILPGPGVLVATCADCAAGAILVRIAESNPERV